MCGTSICNLNLNIQDATLPPTLHIFSMQKGPKKKVKKIRMMIGDVCCVCSLSVRDIREGKRGKKR